MSSTIFVQIAAYRDPDLPATLHNLIQRTTQPERLRFGICLQLAADDPPHWGTSAFPDHPQLEVLLVGLGEAETRIPDDLAFINAGLNRSFTALQ